MTNGLAHHKNHFDNLPFNFINIKNDFRFYFMFFMKILLKLAPDWTSVLQRDIWGYPV